MRQFILSTLILLVSIPVLQVDAQPTKQAFETADSLFKQYQLAESQAAYANIAADDKIDKATRVKAYLKLAEQDWKFYNDFPGAIKSLETARELNADIYNVSLSLATIDLENKKYDDALINARQSLNLAGSGLDKINSGIILAKVIAAQHFAGLCTSRPNGIRYLHQVLAILNNILEKQPGNPDASDALIGTGLLLKDGAAVIKGWKSYYLVSDEKNINQALKTGFEELKPILYRWKGSMLNIQQLRMLATGLADSKLFEYAGYVAGEIKKENIDVFKKSKTLQDIVIYAAYIKDVQQVNNVIYPQVARGLKKYEDHYDSLMDKAALKAWQRFSFLPHGQKFDPDTFYNVMNRKYGMEGYSGTTVNYYGMLMGHIIQKELKQINQYGYSTKFTYISVDRLISRDFTSWYGTTNVGGWGDSTTIIQVRKAYMTEPFDELNWMTDPAEHKRVADLIVKKRQDDLEICKKDPYAEPKFLALYLKFNEASKIYKRLTVSGLKNMALNIAFIDEILKLTVASTVFAHEGRHAIDQLYFPKEFKTFTDDERELRAKYSEVIFSLDPKMAFTGSILGSDLDENTNHGKANKRFRKLIVDWMNAHQAEIKDLDKNIPLLMQFDLLTDEQLITICKSGDPFAKAKQD